MSNPKSKSKSASKQSTSTSSSSSSAPITGAGTGTGTTASAPATAPVVTPIPSSTVAQCSALLGQVADLLGPVTQLSARDVRQSLKLRKGGAQVVTDLVALCEHHGITSVGPVTVAAMSAENDRANALNEIGVVFGKVQKVLGDATFSAESMTWQYAMALYSVLQRLAGMDPTLAANLQPVQAFFQTKRTKGTQRTNAAIKKVKAGEEAKAKLVASGKLPASPAPTAGNDGAAAAAPVAPAAPAPTPSPATSGVAHS